MYGKTTDMFRRLKFWLPQNLLTYDADRASNIHRIINTSFKLQNESRLENTQRYFRGMHGMPLVRMHKKKKRMVSVHQG